MHSFISDWAKVKFETKTRAILDKLSTYLLRPHPLDTAWSTALKRALGIGAIIVFILFVLAPFGMHQLKGMVRFVNALEFGAITAVVTFMSSGILPRIFPRVIDPETWTFWKELLYTLFTILLIGLANTAFLYFMGYMLGEFLTTLFYFELYTLAVGVIPVVIFLAIDQNKETRNRQKDAATLSHDLESKKAHSKRASVPLRINGEGEKPELEVQSENIIYCSAGGNYVDIFTWKNDELERTTIRSSLKNIMDQLPDPPFYNCHRSYIVNMDHVESIKGNARNYELVLKISDISIPVSRSKGAELKEELEMV